MPKPTAKLESWSYVTKGHYRGCLQGYVSDHPNFTDGEFINTTVVISAPDTIKSGNTVETKNTRYELGKDFDDEGEE